MSYNSSQNLKLGKNFLSLIFLVFKEKNNKKQDRYLEPLQSVI